jgi:hypothetical protein
VAVCGPLIRGRRPRERVPNLRRFTRLHPHLLHQSVEEVFLLRIQTGLEHALEVVHKTGDLCEVELRHDDLG